MALSYSIDRSRAELRIRSIAVNGLKSIAEEQRVQVRPLTLLAGINSSGKSTLMQSVLLLKQTIDAPYDPGPLLLDGPNVKFTSSDQLFFHGLKGGNAQELVFKMEMMANADLIVRFKRDSQKRLQIASCKYPFEIGKPSVEVRPDSSMKDFGVFYPFGDETAMLLGDPEKPLRPHARARVVRERCFLVPSVELIDPTNQQPVTSYSLAVSSQYAEIISDVIHLPGHRGNPERAYRRTASGPSFFGTFEKYTASVIADWSETRSDELEKLSEDLSVLGLTWKVTAKALDETQVEIQVGRMPRASRGGARDLVNISDVGFGVSQTLPVVTALRVARPGQLVFLEQPEIHLHPRAQVAIAQLLANAANRGVQVVAETHSSLLLLGIQTLVAKGDLPPEKVKLHWFERKRDGRTIVRPGDLDEAGRFGDWPADFDDVALKAESRFLDAAEARLARE